MSSAGDEVYSEIRLDGCNRVMGGGSPVDGQGKTGSTRRGLRPYGCEYISITRVGVIIHHVRGHKRYALFAMGWEEESIPTIRILAHWPGGRSISLRILPYSTVNGR